MRHEIKIPDENKKQKRFFVCSTCASVAIKRNTSKEEPCWMGIVKENEWLKK
jgi:predicted metal-binding protein